MNFQNKLATKYTYLVLTFFIMCTCMAAAMSNKPQKINEKIQTNPGNSEKTDKNTRLFKRAEDLYTGNLTFPKIVAQRLSDVDQVSGTLDGTSRLNDKDWIGPLVTSYDGSPVDQPTYFQIGYDLKGLYIKVKSAESSMATLKLDATAEDRQVVSDDNIRITFNPMQRFEGSYHFIMTAAGKRLFWKDNCGYSQYHPFEGRTMHNKDSWIAEIYIPWNSFDLEPDVTNIWKLNVYRARQAAGETAMAWSNTFAAFNSPQRCGFLNMPQISLDPFIQSGKLKVADLKMTEDISGRTLAYKIKYYSNDGEQVQFSLDESMLKHFKAELIKPAIQHDTDGDDEFVLHLKVSDSDYQNLKDSMSMETVLVKAQSPTGRNARLEITHSIPFVMIDFSGPDKKHPYIFAQAQHVESIRQRITQTPVLQKVIDDLCTEADQFIEHGFKLPDSEGRFTDFYVCYEHDAVLVWDLDSPHKHKCPMDGKYLTGAILDGVWRTKYHGYIQNKTRDLTIAYLATQKPRYASTVRDILSAYAKTYDKYRIYGQGGYGNTTGARIGCETIHESKILCDMIMAYDMTEPSGLYSDQDKYEFKLLVKAMAKAIDRYNAGLNNWQTRHNQALTAAGLFLQDEYILDEAMHGAGGFYFQVGEGVLPGGFFYEEAIGYHIGVASELLEHALILANAGFDVTDFGRLQQMVDVVIQLSDAYGNIPAIGDAGSSLTIAGHWKFFLYAEKIWGQYAQYINPPKALMHDADNQTDPQNKHAKMTSPGNVEPFILHGDAYKRSEVKRKSYSTALHGSKLAIIGGPQSQITTHFGNAGGHAHSDAMAITFNYGGQRILLDSGTIMYSLPLYKQYYKETLAHNTIVVDGQSSSARGADLAGFVGEGDVKLIEMNSDRLFPDVNQSRIVMLIKDRFMVDFLSAKSKQSRQYDYLLHFETGQLVPKFSAPSKAVTSDSEPLFRFFDSIEEFSGSDNQLWKFTQEHHQDQLPPRIPVWSTAKKLSAKHNSTHTLFAVNSVGGSATAYTTKAPGMHKSREPYSNLFIKRVNAPQTVFTCVVYPGLRENEEDPEIVFKDNNVVEVKTKEKRYVAVLAQGRTFIEGDFSCKAQALCLVYEDTELKTALLLKPTKASWKSREITIPLQSESTAMEVSGFGKAALELKRF
jgi:hypothetical protein